MVGHSARCCTVRSEHDRIAPFLVMTSDTNCITVKENAEALVVATKEIGLEVNADKTKYMVMSREQTAGLKSHHEG